MTPPTSRQIAAILADEIAGLAPGTRLSSEHDLMRRFEVTRATVRKAIDELSARYLVRRSQGAGTFVNRRIDYLISSRRAPSLHQTVAAAGAEARSFLLGIERLPVPKEVAAHLGCRPGEDRTRLERVAYIDDEVACFAEEWIDDGVLEHLDVSLSVIESLNEILRSSRHHPIRAWSRAATVFPPEQVEGPLHLDAPAPVWTIETLTTDALRGRPLMFSRSWLRQDTVRVVVEFEPLSEPAPAVHAA